MRGDQTLDPGPIFGAAQRHTTVEQNNTWTDYDFNLRSTIHGRNPHMILRVDGKTNLPASMKVSQQIDGKSRIEEIFFDYPAESAGPHDIYELGVPRTAKVVDRMPSAALVDVISNVEANEKKFGSYFAVVVRTIEDSAPWRAPWVYMIWRDGKKYRFENAIGPRDKPAAKPEAGANMVAWWKTRLKEFNCVHCVVSDGKTVWEQKKGSIVDAPLEKLEDLPDDDDGSPRSLGVTELVMPDMAGYHRGLSAMQDRLLPNPFDSPPNCVWVEERYTDPKNQKDIGFKRFCFDPAHSYLLRRYQWYNLADQPEAKTPSSAFSIDEFVQAPSGVWYPTCVHEDGGVVIWYYIDFNAKFPDSLFKPEARTGDIE